MIVKGWPIDYFSLKLIDFYFDILDTAINNHFRLKLMDI